MNTIEKTFQLPSKGAFGGPSEITLRAMTTREEKILLTARDFTVFERLVESCTVKPKDFDLGTLHQNDIMYLVYALRELTFGNTYLQEIVCPECGAKYESEIDIADMSLTFLDVDTLDEKLNIKLPVCEDELQLKLLSVGDIRRIDKMIKQKTAKGKLRDPEGYEITVKLMETIVTRNGEDFESTEEKQNYVETLNLKDLIKLQNTLSDIEFGLDTTNQKICERCGEDIEVRGLICPEFFHPSK
jgi:hypothetical protein